MCIVPSSLPAQGPTAGGMQHQYGQQMGGYYASQRWVTPLPSVPLPACPCALPGRRPRAATRAQAVRMQRAGPRRGSEPHGGGAKSRMPQQAQAPQQAASQYSSMQYGQHL